MSIDEEMQRCSDIFEWRSSGEGAERLMVVAKRQEQQFG